MYLEMAMTLIADARADVMHQRGVYRTAFHVTCMNKGHEMVVNHPIKGLEPGFYVQNNTHAQA